MEKFDRQLEGTWKLVVAARKAALRMERRQNAFLDSLKKGGGNGSKRVA